MTTFNNGDDHPLWDVCIHGPRFSTDRAASLFVIEAAKQGSTLHQNAMQLVASSRMRTPKGKK